jgi:hypothetical protein
MANIFDYLQIIVAADKSIANYKSGWSITNDNYNSLKQLHVSTLTSKNVAALKNTQVLVVSTVFVLFIN